LADHFDQHFQNEEKVMSSFGYPAARKHADAHRELGRMVRTMIRDAKEMPAQEKTFALIATSLVDHIRGYDGMFAMFLRANGLFGVL
jgi:hemerythrin-like metal-binding protein